MGEVVEIRSFRTGSKYRYFIKNLQNFEIQLSTPVSATPLPMAGDNSTILTKADGNTLRITVSWIIHDDNGNTVELNPYDTAGVSVGYSPQTKINGFGATNELAMIALRKADAQVKFLSQANFHPTDSGFQPTQIEDKYQIIIGEVGISRVGLIESMSFSKQGSSPVTWAASLTFISGDVITA